ncbi:unnamed protein product [Periconia digitata]|uniref:Uncharacterized protein n=1 Tax=Periconia digitata TaxID=1303443 RepID=A0A9W4U367_9PLEO|nr:unnamed protein product [Periconia digitata]
MTVERTISRHCASITLFTHKARFTGFLNSTTDRLAIKRFCFCSKITLQLHPSEHQRSNMSNQAPQLPKDPGHSDMMRHLAIRRAQIERFTQREEEEKKRLADFTVPIPTPSPRRQPHQPSPSHAPLTPPQTPLQNRATVVQHVDPEQLLYVGYRPRHLRSEDPIASTMPMTSESTTTQGYSNSRYRSSGRLRVVNAAPNPASSSRPPIAESSRTDGPQARSRVVDMPHTPVASSPSASSSRLTAPASHLPRTPSQLSYRGVLHQPQPRYPHPHPHSSLLPQPPPLFHYPRNPAPALPPTPPETPISPSPSSPARPPQRPQRPAAILFHKPLPPLPPPQQSERKLDWRCQCRREVCVCGNIRLW